MSYELITADSQLHAFCDRLSRAPSIAFDTEFVSEHTYRPELCLVQVACGERLTLIDPLTISDMRPFWQVVADGTHETIVHAGRQEIMFCIDSVGHTPAKLYDVQLAAGMVGLEYPAGYGSLLTKLLGLRPNKGETRTDWRKRPLSDRQLEYALDDVRYLESLRAALDSRLKRLNRLEWFQTEMQAWLTDIDDFRAAERWRRVTGSASLSPRSLALVREAWLWREQEAERRNQPARLVLRDDLIVELAKRRSSDPKQIGAIRGMERGDIRRVIPEIAVVIERGLNVPEDQLPQQIRSESNSQLMMLGQFLSSALSSICRDAEVAASLVGTPSDVRELIAYRLGEPLAGGGLPILASGWRSEVVGQVLDDLLAGRLSIRIADPQSDQPLVFEPATQTAAASSK